MAVQQHRPKCLPCCADHIQCNYPCLQCTEMLLQCWFFLLTQIDTRHVENFWFSDLKSPSGLHLCLPFSYALIASLLPWLTRPVVRCLVTVCNTEFNATVWLKNICIIHKHTHGVYVMYRMYTTHSGYIAYPLPTFSDDHGMACRLPLITADEWWQVPDVRKVMMWLAEMQWKTACPWLCPLEYIFS